MRQAVADASVVVKWVVEEDHSAKATILLAFDACHAPEHWRAEAVNVAVVEGVPRRSDRGGRGKNV